MRNRDTKYPPSEAVISFNKKDKEVARRHKKRAVLKSLSGQLLVFNGMKITVLKVR